MRHVSRVIALVGLLMLVVASGAVTSDSTQTEGSFVPPLWEPDWSPCILPISPASNYGSVYGDMATVLLSADVDGDGQDEILVGMDGLHMLNVSSDGGDCWWGNVDVDDFAATRQSLNLSWIELADIDGDGLDELLYVTYPDELYIAEQVSPYGQYERMTSEPYVLESSFTRLVPLDHDSDGRCDIIGFVRTPDTTGAFVMYGQDADGMSEPLPFNALDGSVTAAAAGTYSGEAGIWLLCREALWFAPQGSMQAEQVHDVGGYELRIGDLNCDGREEIVVNHNDALSVWQSSPDGMVLVERIDLPFMAQDLDVGDFDGDGLADLCVRQELGFEYLICYQRDNLFGSAMVRLGIPTITSMAMASHRMVVGDFDGDGLDDIAHTVRTNEVGVALANPSAGGISLLPIPGSLVLGTISDGVFCGTPSGNIVKMLGDGSAFARTELVVVSPQIDGRTMSWVPYSACLADVTDIDGEELVAMGYIAGGAVVCLWEFIDDEWTQGYYCTLTGDVRPQLITADVDNDGYDEIAVGVGDRLALCSGTMNEEYVSLMQGDRFLRDIVLSSQNPPSRWEAEGEVVLIDWGGAVGPLVAIRALDDREDIAGLLVKDDELVLQRFRDNTVTRLSVLEPSGPLDLHAADMDGDGLEDLVFAGLKVAIEDEMAWLSLAVGVLVADGGGLYAGDVSFVPGIPQETFIYPYGGLTCGDFDGDGDTDIALMRLGQAMAEGRGRGLLVLSHDDGTLTQQFAGETITGMRVFSMDIDGDGRDEIVSAITGRPPWLSITRVPEVEE